MAAKPSVFQILLVVFTLTVVSCEKDKSSDSSLDTCSSGADCPISLPASPEDDLADIPAPNLPGDDFEEAPEADLEINAYLREFSSSQRAKMEAALEKLNIVLNSEEFRVRVLNHTYNNSKTFVNNNGQTNAEVYLTILKGAETLNGIEDQEVDLDITLYYSNNSTVGYTYPNVNKIWVNNKFFSTYTHGSVAANVVHEWLHKLGYGHDFQRTANRNYSVPYGIGNIVRDLVNNL